MTEEHADKALVHGIGKKLRLAYFVSHPIQYQAPLLRRIALESEIALKVYFRSAFSLNGYLDKGFKVQVKWDVPLLEGYESEFLPVVGGAKRDRSGRPLNYGVRRCIKELSPDVVWVSGYASTTSLQAIVAASSLGIPVLLRTDSTLFNLPRSGFRLAFKRLFFRWLKSRVSGILSAGTANTEYYRHYFGEQFPIFLCRYAVDNEFFQSRCQLARRNREDFRRSLGLEAGRPVILSAGKLAPNKRNADLLEAFVEIAGDRGVRPYLLFVGDGVERAALEKQAERAVAGDVRFLGFRNQTELPSFYDLCDVFVMPAIYEAWGLAVNEAMNAGKAVVVSNEIGCQRDLVQEGVNGFVFKALDVRALADCLRTILASEEVWKSMGAESLRIIQDFSFEQNLFGLRQALEAMVPGFKARPSA